MSNKDIAQQLGISPAALSLAINHKPGISEATRQKIFTQLQELGYGDLIKKEHNINKNICFIIYKKNGEILDLKPFFLLLMEYIEKKASSYNYAIMLSSIDERRPLEPQLKHLSSLSFDGAIIFATEMQDADMLQFLDLGFPLIAMDHEFSYLPCNTVAINNQMGTYQAVEYLVAMGHRHIGYLASKTRISSFEERRLGFEMALAKFGLQLRPEDIIYLRYSAEGVYQDIKSYVTSVDRSNLPSAYVSDDDTVALSAMRAFAECDLRVPEDISIIGFNDTPPCQISSPPLTTISVSKATLAYEAVKQVVDLIAKFNRVGHDDESRSLKSRVGTRLTIRESVKNLTLA